jgi:hypothetical protein
MRRILSSTLLILLLPACLSTAMAESTAAVSIPDKVKANILKRHPKAVDLQASHEIHYKRKLLEVSFKEEGSDTTILELYREDGNLFTTEEAIYDLTLAPAAVKDSLQKNFPGYQLKKAELIVNPNGVGEEFEVHITAAGSSWKISITDKGVIEQKDAL